MLQIGAIGFRQLETTLEADLRSRLSVQLSTGHSMTLRPQEFYGIGFEQSESVAMGLHVRASEGGGDSGHAHLT